MANPKLKHTKKHKKLNTQIAFLFISKPLINQAKEAK
jgi:hypothetical protein